MDGIILEIAWVFNCPACGNRNFVEPLPVEVPPDDEQLTELQEDNGELVTQPKTVRCYRCKARYATKEPPEPEDGWGGHDDTDKFGH